MQLGGRPFNTAALTLEQWMWCILFGVGVLLWGQLITTIPTKRIPKQFSWGSGPPEEIIDATSSLVEDGSSGSLSQDVKRTGQILWIRGLTRLQTQVCLIQLHNSTVSQQLSLKRQSLGSPTSPTSLAAATVSMASAAVQGGGSGTGVGGDNVSSSGPNLAHSDSNNLNVSDEHKPTGPSIQHHQQQHQQKTQPHTLLGGARPASGSSSSGGSGSSGSSASTLQQQQSMTQGTLPAPLSPIPETRETHRDQQQHSVDDRNGELNQESVL